MGVSLAIPILALVIVSVLPPEVIAQAQPVYSIVAALAVAYLTQQGYFMLSKPKDVGTVIMFDDSASNAPKDAGTAG